MRTRRMSGVLFLALAAILAWGGTVDQAKALLRWIAVVAMVAWGIYSLLQKRDRIEHVYAQIAAMGIAIAAVGWLIPSNQSRGLLTIGVVLVLLSLGLLLRSWLDRRQTGRDDTHHQD